MARMFRKDRYYCALFIALASALVAETALAGAFEDCTQYYRPRLRIAGCNEVIRSPSFDAAAKSTAYTNIAELRTQAGALKEAIWNFGQALRFDDANSRAYTGRAEARTASGNVAGAIRDYDKAISLSPSDSVNYIGRGHAYLVRGNADASIRDPHRSAAATARKCGRVQQSRSGVPEKGRHCGSACRLHVCHRDPSGIRAGLCQSRPREREHRQDRRRDKGFFRGAASRPVASFGARCVEETRRPRSGGARE